METPIVIERTYPSAPSKIWMALTQPAQMKQWFFDVPDFKPSIGAVFTFSGGPPDHPVTHLCQVTDIVLERKLSFTWRYEGYPGNSEVAIELFPEGGGTRLKLSHSGLESFPKTEGDLFAVKNFAAGWNEIFGKQLAEFLKK